MINTLIVIGAVVAMCAATDNSGAGLVVQAAGALLAGLAQLWKLLKSPGG